MNFVMGLVIVIILYSGAAAFNAPVLAGFMENCPYEGVNALQQGDRIYSIDGKRVYQYYNVSEFLAQGDGEYDIVVKRDGKKVELDDFEMIPLEYAVKLRAQTSRNRQGYGWEWDWSGGIGSYTEGTLYGETTDFYISHILVKKR